MARGIHSIHNRLFVLFLLSMLSLLLIVSALFYQRTTDQVQDKVSEIARKNVSQTAGLFDLLLRGYDSLSKTISGNFDLQRLVAEPVPKDPPLRFINERTITNTLGAIYYSREDMVGIHVISYSGPIYSYGNSMSVIDPDYAQSAWYKELQESTGEIRWFGVYPNSVIDQLEKRPVFAFGRQLYDLSQHKPIGVILIETDADQALAALSNLKLSPNSEAYIVSPDGRVVASTKPAGEEGSAPLLGPGKIPRPDNEGDVVVDSRDGRLAVAGRPEMADWTVLSLTPDSDMKVELDETRDFLLIMLSVLVVVATALATFVSRTISSPLKRLIQEMKQVEIGNFRGLLHVKSYEEINILVASFNQMVHRMDDLIERVKLSSISEKNAQLQALQSQVNPHFLYNTLDMIYWMLDEKENDRLGRVVLSLSHMFRYSSHWEGSSEVTLREERDQMRHYLTIIKSRLEGRLTVYVDIEERWLDYRLPKMTLQPIIENAVKHGLEPLNCEGVLRVYTEQSGGSLHIVIRDNGPGMDRATLLRLQETLGGEALSVAKELALEEAADGPKAVNGAAGAAGAKGRRGIGLQNVHRRLVLMFGEAYGVQVSSAPDEGTVVTVAMPLMYAQQALEAGEEEGVRYEHSRR
ncbi:cache domain-containing sensor histidine kinase [Paenibacillus caseinilyticus]|uniref:cache domain-containing sensor histidine kinase n=1 Tax=Paenibacillus caseinilyticus TaxID=3098138 RepID=UPI0022B8C371|nr:sensor histidine kinase [Paenibacillus caseinilyticus]MCZ8519885.1 sensor histidine kinase [Paenibacillus caseinilyticus]